MTYTKANGDVSHREVIVVSKPRENYLVYDVSDMTPDQIDYFMQTLADIEQVNNASMKEFEDVTGIKCDSLWRSFKPGGIDWEK